MGLPPGMMMGGVPQSPQFTAAERERFSILLEINQELLYESMQLQHTQLELKRDLAASGEGAADGDRRRVEEVQVDFTQYVAPFLSSLYYIFPPPTPHPQLHPSLLWTIEKKRSAVN
jgi:hypothetical protein